jgi:hypothetical protein
MAQTRRRLRDGRTERGVAEVHSRASTIFEQDKSAFFGLTLADLKVPQNHGRDPGAGSRKSCTHGAVTRLHQKSGPVAGRFLKEAREGGIARQEKLGAALLNQSGFEKFGTS